jgi:3-methyladenine DNA glycosylase AlkD
MNVLGLRLPVMQQVVWNGFDFYKQSEKNILSIWDHAWKTSRWHEVLYLPLFYYRKHTHMLGRYEWEVMKHWIDRIENWEHADALSSLYSILLERYPNLVLPTFKKWNLSNNPWKQRVSIVSLIYYASPKRKAPHVKLVLEMVKPLIGSKDKYVRKGVGWTLRESYKLYPKETFTFLKKHICELSSDSFSYATEKVTKKEKIELKTLRARQK